MNSKSGNLAPFRLPLDESGKASQSELFSSLCMYYEEVIAWYMEEKLAKARASKVLRLLSLLLLVAGGVVPIAAPIFPMLNPAIGYLLLAVAGGLQLLDKYFGFSSAWTRYVAEAMRLNGELLRAQVEWQAADAVGDSVAQRWELVRKYAELLGSGIATETTSWATEFGDSTRELSGSLKARPVQQ